jgi:hypothetical protein
MILKRATLRAISAISALPEHVRAGVMRALTVYLAKPFEEFSTLTTVDRQALAAILRCGDVLLCAGNTRCAELVKRLTRSTWSHVSMYVGPLEDGPDPLCIVEADIAAGVRAIRLSDLDARRISVLRPVRLDDTERARLAESVLRHIGSEYDLAHAWALCRRFLNLPAPRTMVHDAKRFICSSLLVQAFLVVGHPIATSPAGYVVPRDFESAAGFEVVKAPPA